MPLPTVSGTLVADVDPNTWGLADGTALSFANSGLTPVGTAPTLKTNVFGSLPAVKAVTGQGASIARPVQDDFTLYGVFKGIQGQGASAAWYGNASLMDCEHSGTGNDFGVTVRADGRLTGGVGSPDTTITGTANISSVIDPVIVVIRRTKATGLFRVYVNGVQDITMNINTASLNFNPNLYFFRGESSGQASGYMGRFLAWDDDHSDADRNSVEAYLAGLYPPTGVIATPKVLGYAVTGTIPAVIGTPKVLGYGILGPGNPHLSAAKVIAYAVIEEMGFLPPQVY